MHTAIIIPGLGDGVEIMELATRHWQNKGLVPLVYSVGWRDDERSFTPKLTRLLELIDELHERGKTISLVGTSAGGSAAINAFIERRDSIHRVINVCGRLRIGPTTGVWSFGAKTKTSPSFADSVMMCETHQKSLTDKDLQRVMTIRPIFDETVPKETVGLAGANNIVFPSGEHVLSISLIMTLFSHKITSFLKED
ncbi:MAG: hypothetical protein WAV30_04480 [Microgenomates group bacterium]